MFILMLFCISFVVARSVEIDLDKQSVVPGEMISFKITIYEGTEKIGGDVMYGIYDTYEELVSQGTVSSGETVEFIPNKDVLSGYWMVVAKSEDIKANRLFNVDELEEADLIIEEDTLVIRNIGNTEYSKQILINIGGIEEVIEVLLGIGQEKRLKLVAPDGIYDVRVSDGVETVQKSGVSLTGNVIGIEALEEGGFMGRYPLVVMFAVVIFVMFIVVSFMKVKKKVKNNFCFFI